MHSDFSYLPNMLAATLYQKLSRFPTRNAYADAESNRLDDDGSMMGGVIGNGAQTCARLFCSLHSNDKMI